MPGRAPPPAPSERTLDLRDVRASMDTARRMAAPMPTGLEERTPCDIRLSDDVDGGPRRASADFVPQRKGGRELGQRRPA